MADLSEGAREHLSPSQFALPKKAKTAKQRAKSGNYPIPDAAHARAALSLVAKHGTPDEQAKVRAAVHRKFPGIQ